MSEGKYLKKHIDNKGINVTTLGEKMGIPKTTMYKILAKETLLDVEKDDFIKYLKLPKDFFKKIITETSIPFYDLGVSAGDIAMFDDMAEEEPNFYMSSPDYNDCKMGLRVYGSSMEPYVSGGDYVIVKEIKDLDLIQLGETYIIITAEQRMLKNLRKADKETELVCESINPKFDSFNIKKSKIKKLFIVKGVLKRVSN